MFVNRFSFRALLLCLITSPVVAAKIEVRILVDGGFYPYCWNDSGRAKGAYVDLLEAAGKRLDGYTLRFQALPWKRALHNVEFDSAFAVLPTYKREQIRPWIDYTLPLFEERIVTLLNVSGRIKPSSRWPDDFQGARIGLNDGFVTLEPWKNLVVIEKVRNNEQALKMLQAKRIDAYTNDEFVMQASIRDMKRKGTLPDSTIFVTGPTVSTETTYLSLTKVAKAKYPWMEDFRQRMGAELERMRKSGEIKKIMQRYAR
jgi:polar amino acid transport system substrate-binding protein